MNAPPAPPEAALAELLRPELGELTAYVPHAGEFAVRLDANEAPPLLSPAARARLGGALADVAWERYPDATLGALRAAIAAECGVTPEEILPGVGSDEVITFLLTALGRPRGRTGVATVVTTTPTFVMYRMSARVRGLRVVEVPLDADWDLSVPALEKAVAMSQPNLVFIASPNNPTGNLMDRERLRRVVEAAPEAIVVIDEAYVAYADGDHLDLYREFPQVALLRTLSKVGFAALRVGWLVARPWLVREVDKVRQPYNLSTPAQRLATLALTELGDERARLVATVRAERARLSAALGALPGVAVTPSQANFLWVETPRPAGEVFAALAARGVLVRSFHARGGRLTTRLRITVGTAAENDALLAALPAALDLA